MAQPSPAQIKYMEEHRNDDRAPNIVICGSICLATAATAVVLRLMSRRLTGLKLGADDFLIVVSLGFYIAFTTFLFLTIRFGMGKHIIFVTNVKWFTLSITIAEALYCITILAIKTSILMFYRRIFPQKWFHILIWVMVAVCVSYTVAMVFASVMQCMPIDHQWDPTVPAYCINYFAVVVFSGVLNSVTDFIILGMPIPVINSLKITGPQKRMLSFVFAWGMGTCVVSIARCVEATALQSTDQSWDLAGTLYPTTLELCMGIFSACVPTFRPLLARVWKTAALQRIIPTKGRTANPYQMSIYKSPRATGWSEIKGQDRQAREDLSPDRVHVLRDFAVY